MRVTLSLDARRPWPDLLALAGQAEQAGWDAVRVSDPDGDPTSGADCWTVLGALSVAVPRVRLDAVVRDDTCRHPAVVAKLASTVDQLSGGRLLLGVVPGADPQGQARLTEACEVVRRLARDDRTTFQGRFYRLQDAPLDPKPVQHPFPVMLVGGSAELAARIADHWTISGSQGTVQAQLAALGAAAQEVGRYRGAITVSVRPAGARTLGEYAAAGARGANTAMGAIGAMAATGNAGFDELVVPHVALGADSAKWPGSLADLRRLTEAFGSA